MNKISFMILIAISFIGCQPQHDHMNLEIIKSTYEGKNSAENAKNLMSHLADTASWTEAAGFPYAGTYIGATEIKKNVFDRIAQDWTDYIFKVEGYVAQGDTIVAYGTYTATYKKTGKFFKARVAHLWKLKNGKITSFEQFVDSKMVTDAMD
ncbi:nuclear transport factor 2 family protein [Aquimarina rhabdastrellae]